MATRNEVHATGFVAGWIMRLTWCDDERVTGPMSSRYVNVEMANGS